MQTYKEFSPTPFDSKGLNLPDQQDWLVLPIARNRDSGHIDQSNFDAAVEMLGGESETVEIHRFGHWACGWFEIILVEPGTESVRIAETIEKRLEDYPILDEDDFSNREYSAAYSYWETCGLKERIRICAKYGASIFAARRYEIPEQVEISYLAE
jgi:hypothetical protein